MLVVVRPDLNAVRDAVSCHGHRIVVWGMGAGQA
jgi:hypothetical protein